MKKALLFISILSLIMIISPVFAEEEVSGGEQYGSGRFESSVFGGYYLTDVDGSSRAAEFEYPGDSLSFGGELRALSLPHRLHFDAEVKNRKDFFGDATYAYRDLVFLHVTGRSLFHNLPRIELIDLNPSTASPGADVRDRDETYGKEFRMTNAFLRVKTPDFPLHVYVKGSLVEKKGKQQMRSLLGAGYFNNIVRSSRSRDIDWETTDVVLGANSHLGPLEVDISHGEKRFDVSGHRVFYDSYAQAGFGPPPGTRAAGIYAHHLVPELKSSTTTVKIHTSYTGRLVVTSTFTKSDKDNRDSDATAEYVMGGGQITLFVSPGLVFFTQYRYLDIDRDNPETVNVVNRVNNTAYVYSVRSSISSISNKISETVRYRPASWITLRGKYSFEDVDRKDAEEWHLPNSTQWHNASLAADIKFLRGLDIKARYVFKDSNSPAYNTEPDISHEGNISLSWVPSSLPRFSGILSYSIRKEKRSGLHFLDTEEPDKRDVENDTIFGSVSFLIRKDLSATASYAYMKHRVRQDIEYHDSAGIPSTDTFVPYKDTANSYSLDLTYMPKGRWSLNAGIQYSISRGRFQPGSDDLLEPVSVASFSGLKVKEWVYTVSGEYEIGRGFSSGIRYRFSDFDDAFDNPYDDVEDGEAHIVVVTLVKHW